MYIWKCISRFTKSSFHFREGNNTREQGQTEIAVALLSAFPAAKRERCLDAGNKKGMLLPWRTTSRRRSQTPSRAVPE